MIELCKVDDVNKAASRFDFEKLAWLNQHYLKTDDPLELATHFVWHLREAGIDPEHGPEPADVIVALRDRVKTFKEMAERAKVWYLGIEAWDEAAVGKHLAPAGDVLRAVRANLDAVQAWSVENVHAALQSTADTLGLGIGKVAQPLRVAVTGSDASPPMHETLGILGKQRVMSRIDAMLKKL
jgi:glutamyl-tRNA synthetase